MTEQPRSAKTAVASGAPDRAACVAGDRVGASYLVQQRIGSGGNGQVYLARDLDLSRAVALKFMTVQGHPSEAEFDADVERFRKEAQALGRLSHSNIVTIHGFGFHQQTPYIAMELAGGEGLDALLARDGRLPLADVITIGQQLAAGLDAAHRHGVVHRDVKPSNIRIKRHMDGQWSVKIVDFGIARSVVDPNATATRNPAPVGTPAYMAPEQISSGAVDARTDVYAAGIVLFQMLTGSMPLEVGASGNWMAAHLQAAPRLLDVPGVARDVQAALLPALAKQPVDRPASVGALVAGLRDAILAEACAGPSTEAAPPGPSLPSQRPDVTPSPIVGRDLEIQSLLTAAGRVQKSGLLHIALVVGPPGAGRTTLLQAVHERLGASELAWNAWAGSCSAQPLVPAYEPFAQMLGQQFGTERGLNRQGELHKWLSREADVMAEVTAARAALLAGALGWAAVPSGSRRADAEHAVREAFSAWIRVACQAGPVALLLDDVDAARASTLDLLSSLTRTFLSSPLFIVLSGTFEQTAPILEQMSLPQTRIVAVELAPLSPTESHNLLDLLLAQPLPDHIALRLAQRSEGLPQTLVHLARSLRPHLARDPLSADADLPKTIEAVDDWLDRSLQTLATERLERLGKADQNLLEALVVAGDRAEPELVEALLGVPETTGAAQRLRALGILARPATAAPSTLAFASPLWRAFAGERVRADVRSTLHQRAAQFWMARPTLDARRALAIAHHLTQAGDARAGIHLVRAAEEATRSCAFREAMDLFGAAIHTLESVLVDCQDGELRQGLGTAYSAACVGFAQSAFQVGETERAEAQAHLILGQRERHDAATVARTLEVLGDTLELRGDYDAAIRALAEAEGLAGRDAALVGRACRAASRRCMVLWKSGAAELAEVESESALIRYRNAAPSPDLSSGRGRLHTSLGHLAARSGDFDGAARHYESARVHFDAGLDPVGSAMAQLSLGNLAYRTSNPQRAEACWREAITACQVLDYPNGEALAQNNLGTLLWECGELAPALGALRRAERIKRDARRLDTLPETLRVMADVLLASGDATQAAKTAREAQELAQKQQQPAFAQAAAEVLARAERQHGG